MSSRRSVFRGSLERLRAAASVMLTGAVPGGRFGPNVSAADWNNRFQTSGDIYVDETTALNVSAVHACVALLSDTMSQLPIGVYQRDGERRLPLPDHPVSKLLSGAVNDYQGRRGLVKVTEARRQLTGNGYQQIERREGVPVGLWPLVNAAPRRLPDGQLIYEVGSGGDKRELSPADVIHIRGLSTTNGLVGESPLAAMRRALTLGIHAENFGADFFKNEARSGGFLLHPGRLTEDAKNNIRRGIKQQGRDDNARSGAGIAELGNRHNDIKILEEGMKWVATTIAPEEAQFLSTRQFQLEEICRWYRVPLVLVQSVEKTTSWGSGVEQLMIGFASWTVAPLAMAWEEELSLKLLTPEEREQGLYVRVDLRGLLRGDMTARANFYASAITHKWMTPNEARAREDLDPLPDGDTFEAPAKEPRTPVIE